MEVATLHRPGLVPPKGRLCHLVKARDDVGAVDHILVLVHHSFEHTIGRTNPGFLGRAVRLCFLDPEPEKLFFRVVNFFSPICGQ